MHAVGVDIVEISRIERAVQRWGWRFLQKVYSEEEIHYCGNRSHKLAGRFAGKEAVMKALGLGNRGIAWREIEILSMKGGKPLVCLSGRAKQQADRLGLRELSVSLSHSKDYAVAFVVGGRED